MVTVTDIVNQLMVLLMADTTQKYTDFVQTDNNNFVNGSCYDFIVVGAGAAGSAIAERLSEIPEWNVLLLEAGGQETRYTRTPLMYPNLPSTYYWPYTTTEQARGCRALNGLCRYTSGKIFGGNGGISNMYYNRGLKSDYDSWGAENCGWSFADLEPLFRMLENSTVPYLTGYGNNGPNVFSSNTYYTPAGLAFVEAFQSKGMALGDCANSNEGDCVEYFKGIMLNGERFSSSRAYLEPSASRRNLQILSGAEVTRLLIDGNTVQGVQFQFNNQLMTAYAKLEVILSAGAINSPKLLMLSGIGPREHLQSLGINVVADLPSVGCNLKDHVASVTYFKVREGDVVDLDTLTQPGVIESCVSGNHGICGSSGTDAVAFANGNPPLLKNRCQILANVSAGERAPLLTIRTSLMYPESSGKVSLKSSNPNDQPDINPAFFHAAFDVEQTVKMLRLVSSLVNTTAFKRMNATLTNEVQPLCKVDDYLCIMFNYSRTLYHAVGTAKMGKQSNNGVVDCFLRVYGVNNLRVADSSIAPSIVGTNTYAMTLVIGEKAAEIIKYNYLKPTRLPIRACQCNSCLFCYSPIFYTIPKNNACSKK